MQENIQLKLFTVADLKSHFLRNQPVEMLSEEVIAPVRAYAVIMNPFAKDEMSVVSAIFVNGNVAAYTYVFPDQLDRPDRLVFWNTVLYVDPKYEGRGYGFVVIGQMVEQYGDDYFDLDAVPASVNNLKYAGLNVEYVDQYVFEQKRINTKTFRGKLAYLAEEMKRGLYSHKKKMKALIKNADYTLSYCSCIDDVTYEFIKEHSSRDVFLRSRQMLNWILSYPFILDTPLSSRVVGKCAFASTATGFRFYAVKVEKNNKTIGFYLFRHKKGEVYMNYLYYDSLFENEVFMSITEHLLYFNEPCFFTANKDLCEFVKNTHLYAKNRVYKKSFSYPKSFAYDKTLFIQAGDGDNIT